MDQENYNDIDMEIEMDSNDIDVSAEMPNEIVVDNYNSLKNKPSINNVELSGNKTLDELGIQEKGEYLLPDDIKDFATKKYVDEIVGDINTVLDEVNGEVI